MKRFIITFSAVLAAGAIILGAYLAWVRLDRWEQAKQVCYAELNAAIEADNPYSGSDLSSLTASISWQVKRLGRLGEAMHALQTVLEHKPFGLPVGFAYTAVVKGAVALAKAARPLLKP